MSTPWYDLPITNGYSTTKVPGNWDSPHYAIDIGMPMNTSITDLLPGTVVKADYAPWGGEVFVKLANGLQEYFYHLNSIAVSVGQSVKFGDPIGLSGGQNVGGAHPVPSLYSSGPHLHFGITNGSVVPGPAGQQYYGVDPTSVITEAKNGLLGIGGGGVNAPTGLIIDPTLGAFGSGSDSLKSIENISQGVNQIGSLAQNLNNFLDKTDWMDASIRAVLIVIGIVIVVGGLYLFVSQ